MKLLLLIDDYLPHSTRVAAKMFHDLAVEFLSMGHEVTVITPNDKRSDCRLKEYSLDGVRVWAFKSGAIKDCSNVKRAVNETRLSHVAYRAIKHALAKCSFDGIVYYSPSIFWGPLVRKLKKRFRCPAYLVLRDFFPQWTIDAGMMREGSLIACYFRYFESYSYQQADMIGVMSEANRNVFRASQGNSRYPLEILRNWASHERSYEMSNLPSLREKLGLKDKVIFFYGGNIGTAQDMPNLVRLAKAMSAENTAHFVFLGQGDQFQLVKDLVKEWNLNNVSILPSVDQQTFKHYLNDIDVGLFSLAKEHTAHNFPGKLLGYMVNKVPILGSVNQGNDLFDTINNNHAGYVYCNGADDELSDAATELLYNHALRQKLGEGSFKLLNDQFSVAAAANKIINSLTHVLEKRAERKKNATNK